MSPRKDQVWTEEERAAMKEHAREQKAAAKRVSKEEDEQAVLAKIAELEEPDRAMAMRVHEIVKASAPELSPKLWYGMPAYARDGRVICFFQPANKFKARYSTLGFNDGAELDEGFMWPVAYALTKMTPVEETRIGELVRRAAG